MRVKVVVVAVRVVVVVVVVVCDASPLPRCTPLPLPQCGAEAAAVNHGLRRRDGLKPDTHPKDTTKCAARDIMW